MKAPRVLHLLAPASYGGLERMVSAMAVGRARTGAEVHVAALLETGLRDPDLLAELRRAGVTVHALRAPGRGYLSQLRQLRALVSSVRPHIVHSHGYIADVLSALSGIGRVSAWVTTVHGFTGGGRKNRTYEWLQRRAFGHCDAVIAVSARLRAELASDGIPGTRLHCIPNAYSPTHDIVSAPEARDRLGIPTAAFSIGWIGRLSQEKGPDLFLEALALLDKDDWRATLVGDGRERSALEATARALGIEPRVGFAGVVPDAPALLRAFDLIVISSRTEGTPMSLLEAMAAGVPVVTAAVGGIPDVVTGSEALLVQPGNAVALAAAIREARASSQDMSQRAIRAEEVLATRFSIDLLLSRYEEVYRTVSREHHALSRT